MTPFLSELHAELRRALFTKRGATHHPKDVPRGTHKEYVRMERVILPNQGHLDTTLADALGNRNSAGGGNAETPVLLQELGSLFGLSLRKRPHAANRNYPSGGALYPVETYLISTAIESQSPAVFHYNPTLHVLERLCSLPSHFSMKEVAKRPETLPLSSLIVFTSVWHRSAAKYGDLAYLHALIEAGHMSENILLVGGALGLNMRPYAGFNDSLISELLDLDEAIEQPVHTITLCKASNHSELENTDLED